MILEKWYLDAVFPDGTVWFGYRAKLRLRGCPPISWCAGCEVSGAGIQRKVGQWKNLPAPESMPLYASIYLAVPSVFLLCADRAQMRRLASAAWMATLLNTLLYLMVPATAAFRSVTAKDWMSGWLAWEQRMALPAAGSCPSFHVTWAILCAAFLARGPLHRVKALCWLWCLGVILSCLTTGMHSVADVLAGALTGILCDHSGGLWRWLLGRGEQLGNAWKAWRIGPLRIMNHSVWAGLAGCTGVLLAGMSADSQHLGWVMLVAACAVVGAGLWAQWVEGSPELLRPFGYYGSIVGGLIALGAIACLGGPVADLLAAFAVASPWAQAIGRLRCLVQGCCHGHPVNWGIRVTNPHSRVSTLAGWSGSPIHPTPIYSILANVVMDSCCCACG
jgi:membrane-associated phospholipid phosphatase